MRKIICLIVFFLIITLSGCSNYSSDNSNTSDCNIKGNISYKTGEKIYHVQGQQFYEATEIDKSADERWFCSEQKA